MTDENDIHSWGYRVVRFGPRELALCEVFYDEAGEVVAWVDDPVVIGADENELTDEIVALGEALLQEGAILNREDMPGVPEKE